MRIAVASGKGGTGKTMVATSLALSLANNFSVHYLDCDVEAPNGHLFLNPTINQKVEAVIRIPNINKSICSACGRCVEVCQFHALVQVGKSILLFPQLCHGCGSCSWNCPEQAISEISNPIGILERGITSEGIQFSHGELTISEPMPTPIIRQLKKLLEPDNNAVVILDSPPGASCSVVETLRGTEFALLVTEPTPFGMHDLRQVLGIINDMGIPAGVIINRHNGAYSIMDDYCRTNNLPVLMKIPYKREIAHGLAKGMNLIQIFPDYQLIFQNLFAEIRKMHLEKFLNAN